MSSIDGVGQTPLPVAPAGEDQALQSAAEKLEAAFLSEMLKASDFGETPSAFGGGAGEDQFASFMRDATAEAMVEAGGIGLAEQLFRSLSGGTDIDP